MRKLKHLYILPLNAIITFHSTTLNRHGKSLIINIFSPFHIFFLSLPFGAVDAADLSMR